MAIDEADDAAECRETHLSWVLLSGDRAFKVAKPIRTDVVDQRDLADRRRVCESEVELNRRLSPDVYQGVGSISLDGEELEPVIVMKRMPKDRRLSALLDTPDATGHVRSVARTVASFHAATDALGAEAAGRVSSQGALRTRWNADIEGMRTFGGAQVPKRVDHLEKLAHRYLAGRAPLFDQRIADGLVRDGHGDLLADDIFCLEDGPRVLDCLAFSDELRHGDVLADVAFLVMDLQRLGHRELARKLLRDYCEFSDEHHAASLAHFYVAQRALVRAKVTALRYEQTHAGGDEVIGLLDLAADHLERATIRVALVGGIPGSGKSTISERMGDELGWTVLSSDAVRRDLGLRNEDLGDDRGYEPEAVAEVYQELLARAEYLLSHGLSVVLDASWTSAGERSAARAMAVAAGAEVVEVRCDAPAEECRRRVATRSVRSDSEATPSVVDLLVTRTDPWPEASVIDTAGSRAVDIVAAFRETTSAPWWVISAAVTTR